MNRELLIRGCRLSYQSAGQGPAVLFIQGVGVHGEGWRPQINDLVATHRCLCFDNRGMGRSQPTGCEVTVAQMAADALAVLDSEGASAADVVGHSLGGLVAIQLALDAPTRVRSLSLLCTFPSGRMAAPPTPRMIWLGMRTRIGTRRMRRRAFVGLILPPGTHDDVDSQALRLAELFGHDLGDQPPIVAEQLRALRATDLTERLTELAGIPALVVNAANDPIAPPLAGRRLHDGLIGSRYVEVPDASHGLPITHSAIVNQLLRSHLSAAASPGHRL